MATLSVTFVTPAFARNSVVDRLDTFRLEVERLLAGDDSGRREGIRAAFDRQFSAMDAESINSQEEADAYLKALADVTFHQPDSVLSARAMDIVAHMESAGMTTTKAVVVVDRMLFADRNFVAERRWRDRYPALGLSPIQRVDTLGMTDPNAFLIGGDGVSLLELRKRGAAADGLVIVSHPACGFSRQAAEWMREQLPHSPLSLDVTWLSPVDGLLHVPLLAEWNARFPAQAMALARTAEDWPFITTWDTPQLYWLESGQVRERSVGWTDVSRDLVQRFARSRGAMFQPPHRSSIDAALSATALVSQRCCANIHSHIAWSA